MSLGNKKSKNESNSKLKSKKESETIKKSVSITPVKTSRAKSKHLCIPEKRRVSTESPEKNYVAVTLIPRVQTKRANIENGIMEKEFQRKTEYIPFSLLQVNPYHIFNWGKCSSELPGPTQNYNILHKECAQKNFLFEDTIFPAIFSSLLSREEEEFKVIWKRPPEFCHYPKFFMKITSDMQINKGLFSNAALVGAFTTLARNTDLLNEVVWCSMSFSVNYAGIFRFRFWNFNKKVEVVVDDRLPFLDDQLLTMQCNQQNLMWFALLEKAYAKLLGSYEALLGVTFPEILKDLTGGIVETYELPNAPENLLHNLVCSFDCECLINVSTPQTDRTELTDDGLLNGGTIYIVVNILKFLAQDTQVNLIKFRTTRGKVNWKGPWSKYSVEWNSISEIDRKLLGLIYDENKEFWMTYEESLKHFTNYFICYLNCRYLEYMSCNSNWGLITRCGRWVKGLTAGGGPEEETIYMNYQYEMRIVKKTSIIFSLSQKLARKANAKIRDDYTLIGMSILKLHDACLIPTPLTKFIISEFGELAAPSYFYNQRDVVVRYELEPGTYYLIPSTLKADIEGEFLLKVYSNIQFNLAFDGDSTECNTFKDYDQNLGLLLPEKDCACGADSCQGEVSDVKCQECSNPPSMEGSDVKQSQNYNSKIFDQNFSCISPVNPDNQKILNAFWAHANGNDEVEWTELKKILKHNFGETFKEYGVSICDEVCRNLVSVYDPNTAGKVGGQQFNNLCIDLQSWIDIFKTFDVKNNKKLERELWRVAFNEAKLGVTTEMLIIIMYRYGNIEKSLDFDDFLKAILKLKYYAEKYLDVFKNSKAQSHGISIENFMSIVVPA